MNQTLTVGFFNRDASLVAKELLGKVLCHYYQGIWLAAIIIETDQPTKIIQTTRLGIPKGRDEHLLLRFIDYQYAAYCTSNPLTKRHWQEGKEYQLLDNTDTIHV